MPEQINLGRAHVEFTADFAKIMSGMKQAVIMVQNARIQINQNFNRVERDAQRTGRNVSRSLTGAFLSPLIAWNRFANSLRHGLRMLTMQLVFLQLDVQHVASQFRNMAAIAAGGLLGAVGAAVSFEDAFADVRKTVDGSEEDFQALNRAIREMGTRIDINPNDLAGLMGVAGQLGIRGVQNLTRFTETIAQLQIATDVTGEAGAASLAQFMNIMQESFGNVDRVGAALVDLGNRFAATESQILSMAERIAGAGKTVGLTTAQVLGLATAMASVGINAEMGGSAISRVFITMANSVATGGRELSTFARVAGMSSRQFSNLFREDAAQALQSFILGLRRMHDNGENVFQVLDDIGAGDIRVRDTLLRLLQASDIMTDALNRANQAWDENSALLEEVRKRQSTTGAQLRILARTFVEIARTIGDMYLPAIQRVTERSRDFLSVLINMTDEQRVAVARFGALVTAILSGIAATLLMAKAIATLGTGVTLLARAVVFLLSPWSLAIAAVLLAAHLIRTNWDAIVETISKTDLGEHARRVWDSFKKVWTDDSLSLPQKVIKSVQITVNEVVGLIDSIISWWLKATIKLVRKTLEFLGLDPDESGLVKFLEKISEWWDRQTVTLPEKTLGIASAAVTVAWAISFLRGFAEAVAAQAGFGKGTGRGGARWLFQIGKVAAVGFIVWELLPENIKQQVKELWEDVAQRIREFNAETIKNPFIDRVADWLANLPTDGWELPALTIGATFAGFKLAQAGTVIAGLLGRAVGAVLAGVVMPIAVAGGLLVGLGLVTMAPGERARIFEAIRRIWADEELSITLKVTKILLLITEEAFRSMILSLQEQLKPLAQFLGLQETAGSMAERQFLSATPEQRAASVSQLRESLGPTAISQAPSKLEQFINALIRLKETIEQGLGFQHGAILPGFGGGDRIPALLEPGEAVVPARVVKGGLNEIVAWFKRMGVSRFQSGGIAGISTLAQAEAQIGTVNQEMTRFADQLLSGINRIAEMLEKFIFGMLQTIVDLLKVLFPEHAETLQKGLDNLRKLWENMFQEQKQSDEENTDKITEAVGGESRKAGPPPLLQRVIDFLRQVGTDAFQPLSKSANEFAQGLSAAINPFYILASILDHMNPVLVMIDRIFEILGPIIAALMEPIMIVAEAFAKALAPVLKAMFPIFKLLAIIASFLGEVFFRLLAVVADVVAGIAKFVGGIIKGIGDFLGGINIFGIRPFGSIGDSLSRTGQNIINFGKSAQQFADDSRKSADELAKAREIVTNLTYEEAEARAKERENLEKVNEQLRNVPEGFKIALRRFQMAVPAQVPQLQGGGFIARTGLAVVHRGERVLTPEQQGVNFTFIFEGPVYGVDDLDRRITRVVTMAARRAGLARHGLAPTPA